MVFEIHNFQIENTTDGGKRVKDFEHDYTYSRPILAKMAASYILMI